MRKLENKVALIVAATRGIGLASAQALAAEGARVYLGVRRLDAGQETANEISKKYATYSKAVYFDASKIETYESMVKDVVADSGGKLHILVNNFGGTNPVTDLDAVNTSLDMWHQNLLSNLDSVFLPTKYAVPYMAKSGGGSIVNISSMASVLPDLTSIAYGTVKSGINSLTRNIATQYARQGIRCNAVLPGMVATDAVKDNISEEFKAAFLRHVPLNRVGEPEDIANAVLFFASNDSSYITGQCLEVAGGMGVPTPFYADTVASMGLR